MAHNSGIKANQLVRETFKRACVPNNDIRGLILEIKDEQICLAFTITKTNNLEDDFKTLNQRLAGCKKCSYILFKISNDVEGPKFCFYTYVPESSKIKERMLFSSSKGSIKEALGSDWFVKHLFCNNIDELSYKHYKQMTDEAKKNIKIMDTENLEAQQRSNTKNSYLAHKTIKPKLEAALEEEIKGLNSADKDVILTMKYDKKEELVILEKTLLDKIDTIKELKETNIKDYFNSEEPIMAIIRIRSLLTENILLCYCPEKSKVRSKMIYSSNLLSLVNYLKDEYFETNLKRIEIDNEKELNFEYILDSLNIEQTNKNENLNPVFNKENLQKFSRPKAPSRRPTNNNNNV